MIQIIGDPATSNEAYVDDFTDMQTALLDESGDYQNINVLYFTQDIAQPAQGIVVPVSKGDVIIDGQGFTYTTAEDSAVNRIGYANPYSAALKMIMKNMTIIGNNWYGALSQPDFEANSLNVTLAYHNVTYAGDQTCFIRYGTVEYIDCTISVTFHEIAECAAMVIGGATSITHDYALEPINMVYNAASHRLEILDDADVRLYIKQRAMLICSTSCRFIVGERARLYIETVYGICQGASSRLALLEVKQDAEMVCVQTGNNYPMFYVGAEMTVAEGAYVSLTKTTGANPLLNFSGTQVTITQPRLFLLRSATANAVTYAAQSTLVLEAGQINLWNTAPTDGGMDDVPTYSWFRPQPATSFDEQEPAQIQGNAVTASFTKTSTNLADDDLTGKALTLLKLNTAFAFSMGDLPLWVNPIAEDDFPVYGKTSTSADLRVAYTTDQAYTETGAADAAGAFRIDKEILPLDTPVMVTASLPYLLSVVETDAVEVGELVLTAPPENVEFTFPPVTTAPNRYGRDTPGWTLTVADTRARSAPWRLYATINRELTSFGPGDEPLHSLPGALVFVDDEDTCHVLSTDTPTLVWSGTENGGNLQKAWTVTWGESKGLLMTSCGESIRLKTLYTASIFWSMDTDPVP